MKFERKLLTLLCIIAFSACQKEPPVSSALPEKKPVVENPLFVSLPPTRTGLNFINNLVEGLNTNILMYEYFYNGGGVATADFNGDGLIDIYLTANMQQNKLFLNKGNLSFADITTAAGVQGREGPWKTGVTYADVNGDGKLDIYVCYSGTVKEENRANQLFINEGNDANNIPRFSEKAKEFGIASVGYSNQGYFFDYDKDGDLDLLLINHNPQSMPVLNEVSTKEILKKDDPLMGVRLYKQADGKFEDVTVAAGISSSSLTYALGAGVADINNDGWDDVYLSNDYAIPDYLYINNRNGTFSDKLQESMGHTSHFSMGNDVADINNDGTPEIFTLDMLPEDNARQKLLMAPDNYGKFELNLRSGFYYQYMRNMLQLNNGNGTFSEMGQFAGISNTDWSWAALFADYNNDGLKDLFITNGYLRDFTNLDFIKYMDDVIKRKGRLKRQDVLDMVSVMPSSNVNNYIFSNTDGLVFKNESRAWGMDKPSNSNGAAYADLDNDGDLDLVVNNINQNAFLFENKSDKSNFLKVALKGRGKNTLGIGAKVTVFNDGKKQYLQQVNSRGYLSAVSPVLHFGLGKYTDVDSLIIEWPSAKTQRILNVKGNTELLVEEVNAGTGKDRRKVRQVSTLLTAVKSPVECSHAMPQVNDFKRQSQLISQLSFSAPVFVAGDVNNDKRLDIYSGGGNGMAACLYIQDDNEKFVRKPVPAFDADINFTDAGAAFVDVENDGDLDLYVASGGYHNLEARDALLQDRLYLNDGKGNFEKAQGALPAMLSSKSVVVANDFNGDGFQDLFVGGRVIPGRYPEAPESFLLVNNGNGTFRDAIRDVAPDLERTYRITDAQWVDMNGDLKKDLIVAGEWMPIKVFVNDGKNLKDATSQFFKSDHKGWWNKLHVADLNSDGKMDIIAGNHGLNSQYKASESEPIELYFKDFDKNDSVDPLMCSYIMGRSYPYLTRDEMLDQLGFLRPRFPNYKSYSDVTLKDILKEEEIESASLLSVNHLETTLFLSDKDGAYQVAPLPVQSQFSSVNAIYTDDFDRDGNLDILLCGNDSRTKLKIGKLDANFGVLLKGEGSGQFSYVDQTVSGLKLKGDIRSMMRIGNKLLFSACGGPVVAYSIDAGQNGEARKNQIAHVKR